jgi:hypothetical protein
MIWISNQSRAHRIHPHVIPFFRIAFVLSKPMMKTVRLKKWLVPLQAPPQAALPECHPCLDLMIFVGRRTKQMDVIWHDQIKANQPT